MITEDYVSFETAKLLKEKGFNEKTYRCYNLCTEEHELSDMDDIALNNWELDNDGVTAPTLQMAMKWLRDEKGIAIIPIIDSILDHEKFLWDSKIAVAKTNETFSQGWVYENPESGYDRAIRYCLENLI